MSDFEISQSTRPPRQSARPTKAAEPNFAPPQYPADEVPAALPAPAPTPPAAPAQPAQPTWPKEELLRVFDEMLFSNGYSEEVQLANGRVRMTLRTRTVSEVSEIQRILDGQNYSLVQTLDQRRSFETLIRSVDTYNARDLTKMPLPERESFFNSLPAPLIAMILTALWKFDTKVAQACDEGERNF